MGELGRIDSCLSSQHNGSLNEVRHLMYKRLYYPERKVEGNSIANTWIACSERNQMRLEDR